MVENGGFATFANLQGLLGADASAGADSRRDLGTLPRVRRSSEPDESQHLHHLRADVHEGDRARKITIDATIMFADLRGYTTLSQSQSPDAVSGLLDAFYDECASAIWEHDGLLNKTIGDAVMAVFNFPLKREAHARNAVLAARDIQKNWQDRREALVAAHGLTASELGIGIGIHSGELSFGEFGRSHRDLTAIGTVVNTASRAQSVAEADQILVTRAVFERAQPDLKDSHSKAFQLKGFDLPVELYAA